jgi:hypothetical protein
MKFWEAMKALEEGNKVRCLSWEKDNILPYEHEDDPNCITVHIDWERLLKTDWEIYEAPAKTYTFMEAVKLMKEGKTMRRIIWNTYEYIRFKGGMIMDEGETPDMRFIDEDFEATDWIVVEDK